MAHVNAFKALMPPSEKVAEVSAVPYDVVNRDESAALADGNPLSFLHISRSEIDLPPATDPYSDAVYEKAVANFAALKDAAPLSFDDNEFLYIYSQTMGNHTQTGVVAAVDVDDYDTNLLKKHEKTRKAKEDDRTRHTVELRAHSGPVFLLYRGRTDIDTMVADIQKGEPLFTVNAEDGTIHKVWRCTPELQDNMLASFAEVPDLYVADGHHRAKSASRTREALRAANPNHTGNEAYNRFLAVLFPGDQLDILPYNRVVQDLNGHSPEDVLKNVETAFEVTPDVEPKTTCVGDIRMYLEGTWYALKAREVKDTGNVADSLDVAILQDQLLDPILAIDDPRTNERINFIGGIRGTDELEKLVDSGKYAIAFSMFATTVDQLIAISDADEIMPPKSTWFEPKLRDGLLIHCF